MGFLQGSNSPSSEALLPVDAREKTAFRTTSTTDNRQRPCSASKMTCVRRTIMVLLVCMLVLLGIASGSQVVPCHRGAAGQQPPAETSDPSAAVKSASPASLHDLLHRFLPDRFRDGVFSSDHQAMEAVHREDTPLATSILQLAKRDETNSTVSSDSPDPTPTETVTATETSEPPVETTPSTTANPSSTSTSEPPTSSTSEPPVTSTSSRAPTPTTTPSSSSPLPETTLTTSTVPPALTTVSSRTSRQVTHTLTTTSPDGAVVTITATTWVPVEPGETPAPASTTHVDPTLQNLGARSRGSGSALAGVVGFAMLLVMV